VASVAEIMSTNLTTVSPATTVAEAATLMASRHIGSAIVCQGDELVGIFTERDIVRALSQDFDAPGTPIEHWMTRRPRTVERDAGVRECLDIMISGGFRHLPVTEGGKAVGIVSIRDLSRVLSEGAGS
jgi:CBS domain-containing protein